MTVEAVARSIHIRDVELRDWGKVILEEVLFQAAQHLSNDPGPADAVGVSLIFRIAADRDRGGLTITTRGAIEDSIVTRIEIPQGGKF